MRAGNTESLDVLEVPLPFERARLVRLCAHLTGDQHIAEDLAQEALLIVWRSAHSLRDPDKRPQWLAGIARNVCRNWARSQGRELPLVRRADVVESADDLDVELVLERDELAQLLDRALGLLPQATREILIERYVRESPHAEIAELLGLSEDAVSMRLTRGKLLLRRAITTGLRDEAEAYGLYDPASDDWRETRIWCSQCGRRKLLARIPQTRGTVSFRCPACHPSAGMAGSEFRLANAHFTRLIGGLKRPQSILNRTAAWSHAYFRGALQKRVALCTHCGQTVRLQMHLPLEGPDRIREARGVHTQCAACGEQLSSSATGLVMALPEVHAFRRASRIRQLPLQEVETHGQAAVIHSFESVANVARLDVVSLRDTLNVVGVYGDSVLKEDR
ncbi:MAG: RNA polymerase sigma factor [Chloroflexota bacterium]|nr:RNA polymerase sigma factor [Chloroflexota bacterium]